MEKVNCVGCKWLTANSFTGTMYCQMTKSPCHRERLGLEATYSPVVADDGQCAGWVSEYSERYK